MHELQFNIFPIYIDRICSKCQNFHSSSNWPAGCRICDKIVRRSVSEKWEVGVGGGWGRGKKSGSLSWLMETDTFGRFFSSPPSSWELPTPTSTSATLHALVHCYGRGFSDSLFFWPSSSPSFSTIFALNMGKSCAFPHYDSVDFISYKIVWIEKSSSEYWLFWLSCHRTHDGGHQIFPFVCFQTPKYHISPYFLILELHLSSTCLFEKSLSISLTKLPMTWFTTHSRALSKDFQGLSHKK